MDRETWLARRASPSLGRLFRQRANYTHISVFVKDGEILKSRFTLIKNPVRIPVGPNRFITKGNNHHKKLRRKLQKDMRENTLRFRALQRALNESRGHHGIRSL